MLAARCRKKVPSLTPPSGRTVEFLREVPPTVQREQIIEVRLIDDSIGVNDSWDIL